VPSHTSVSDSTDKSMWIRCRSPVAANRSSPAGPRETNALLPSDELAAAPNDLHCLEVMHAEQFDRSASDHYIEGIEGLSLRVGGRRPFDEELKLHHGRSLALVPCAPYAHAVDCRGARVQPADIIHSRKNNPTTLSNSTTLPNSTTLSRKEPERKYRR